MKISPTLLAACLLAPLLATAETAATTTATTVSVSAPATKPITHETLWMMQRVGSPLVSPDGKSVVFSVTEPSYETDKAVSDLWLVPTDASQPPRRITDTKAPEDDPAWSPDSRSIAFSTKREGDDVEQIYILDLAAGGEARRLTSISTGAKSPKWRPDGKAILFESRVYPKALDDDANRKVAAEHKDRKYNVRTYEHFPIRYWNQWLDERQPTLLVQSLEYGSKPQDILSATALAQTAGFSGSETETSVSLAPLWSPDGREVVFTATTEHWNAASAQVGYHLYRMPAAGGAEPNIITPASGDYDDAAFSPDGKTLYFKYAPQDTEVYHLARLNKVAWPAAGDPTLVTRDFDRETAHYAPTPDGKFIYLLVPEAAKQSLYRVSADGAKPTLILEPATGGYTALDIARRAAKPTLIASYGSSVSPSEIVRIDPAARTHVNLTHINTGAGEKFAQAIKLDPLKTPGDEINQAVDEALKRYAFIDGSRMCAAGASYGGHLANWIEATTTRYKCIISHAGEVDLTTQWGISDGIYGRELTNGGPPWAGSPIWHDQSPITYAANWKTPMLLSIGERDYRVPLGNTLENWATLQRMHVPSRLLVWPDAWHWITKPEDSRHFYEEVHRWLATYLLDPAPTP